MLSALQTDHDLQGAPLGGNLTGPRAAEGGRDDVIEFLRMQVAADQLVAPGNDVDGGQ